MNQLMVRSIKGLALIFLLTGLFLSGCATTGRGDFPVFDYPPASEQTLAILPPLGFASNELRGDIIVHLDRDKLENKFQEVKFVPSGKVKEILGENYAGERINREQGMQLAEETGADLVLAFWIHDYVVEQFLTTETRTLYETRTDYKTTIVDTKDDDNSDTPTRRRWPGDREVVTREQRTITREVPIDENQVRVVITISALIYSVPEETVIWRGRRVERAQGKLENISALELTDLVIERIVQRIIRRLR